VFDFVGRFDLIFRLKNHLNQRYNKDVIQFKYNTKSKTKPNKAFMVWFDGFLFF